MARAQLKHGVQGAPGGAREGAGRPPSWLKEKCREIIEKRKLVEFMGDVAAGEDVEVTVTEQGKRIASPARTKDRQDAVEFLAKYGFGESANPQVHITFVQMLVGRFQAMVQRVIPITCPHCAKPLEARKDLAREMEMLGNADIDMGAGPGAA